MPTSDIHGVPAIIEEVCRLQPKRVLDLGCGMGKFGALCREYLDNVHGRFKRNQWNVVIDGVEGFMDYITRLHFAVYNDLWIEDFAPIAESYTDYDVVLMIDSLEHLEKDTGKLVLRTLLLNNKHVIVSVPMGIYYREQGAEFGNEFERHRAKWGESDFYGLGGKLIHKGVTTVFSLQGKQR